MSEIFKSSWCDGCVVEVKFELLINRLDITGTRPQE
jgi:hypothetical protein